MHIVWIHERASFAGGAEHYVAETAIGMAMRGAFNTLLYDPRLPTDPDFLARFDAAFPLLDAAAQLASLPADVIFAHRVPASAEEGLACASARVVRFVHDHQLLCPREHKTHALTGAICHAPVGVRCYVCAPIVRSAGAYQLVSPRRLVARQRRAFSADAIVVGSRYVAEQVIAHGAPVDRVHTLPLYTSPRMVGTMPRAGAVFVGQLVRGKGVDVLLDALADLPMAATIIGDGPERAALEQRAAARGLAGRVTFAGRLPRREILATVAQARALVLPSRVPETFGLVGIEAMSVGTPVVATWVGGVGEWLTPDATGLAIPPDDVAALGRALRQLDDDALVTRLGAAGREAQRARFTPAQHLPGLERVFIGASDRSRVQA